MLESTPLDVYQMIEQVAAMVEITAGEKGLSLHVQVDADVPKYVMGDSLRLRQILINLLSNGIKFTDAGEVRLLVQAGGSMGDDLGEKILFSVKDTGIGMTPMQLKTLFEPFRQAEVSTTRKYGGSGLGLSISRHLVELMGGTLLVKSEPEKGSHFMFDVTLPVTTGKMVQTQQEENAFSLKGKRILVAEDHPVNQLVARGVLENWDVEVDVAADGREAVQMATSNRYDAVLMDVRMPLMNGEEATWRIRKRWSKEALPIIAMTAGAAIEDRNRSLAAGMNDYLSKPIDPNELRKTLGKWLCTQEKPENQDTKKDIQDRVKGYEGLLPDQLPGLHLKEGVERFMGDEEVFRQVLQHTYLHRGKEMDDLQQALEKQDYSTAQFLVHRIRGLSGNISANRVYDISQAFEEALGKQQYQYVNTYMTELAEAMEEMMQALATIFEHDVE